MTAITVTELADGVRQQVPGGPLERIEAALAVSDELVSGADELIGLFVTEARQAGCSWTEIGQRIGVSKQAARQRFAVPRPALPGPGLPRRPRLEACLVAAGREAAADGAAEVGTEHQLVGLFTEGVAAGLLEKLGLRADQVRDAGRELFPPPGPPGEPGEPGPVPPGPVPPESAGARRALVAAATLARHAGCSQVGTEHLLGVLVLDPGSRARRVLIQLGASIPAIKEELECYLRPEGERGRRRRRMGRNAQLVCSFCGKSQQQVRKLIAGPGAYICDECVGLCNEIIAEEPGEPGQTLAGH
jgi:hypothetical protein